MRAAARCLIKSGLWWPFSWQCLGQRLAQPWLTLRRCQPKLTACAASPSQHLDQMPPAAGLAGGGGCCCTGGGPLHGRAPAARPPPASGSRVDRPRRPGPARPPSPSRPRSRSRPRQRGGGPQVQRVLHTTRAAIVAAGADARRQPRGPDRHRPEPLRDRLRGRPRCRRPRVRSSAIAATEVGTGSSNWALPASVMLRQVHHGPTRASTSHRIALGKRQRGIRRCRKRTVARQLYRLLERTAASSSSTCIHQSGTERYPAAPPGRQPRSVARISATSTSSSTGAHRPAGHDGPGR
jgi:hypothetical protein